MTRTELLTTLRTIGVQPSKKLGQNFLIDANMLSAMERDAELRAGETILEIGPGTGVLTERLLAAGCALTAVEYDHRLAAYLRTRFADTADFRLIEGDACDVDFAAVMGDRPYRCVANLPYAVSSILIARLSGLPNPPREMFVLLQKEMADRLAAAPGTKQYGALSIQVQTLYDAKVLRKLPPNVFFPPPEVESSFLRLRWLDQPPRLAVPRADFVALVRHVFTQRRKKLTSTLGKRFGRDRVCRILAAAGVNPEARPEALSPPEFVTCVNRLLATDE
ncbi:MAG: 16S rRNA (adenine(1518)-N(6)/adenine(1519)-N(6))-dimethyltransferase RsmA [Lentisphaeria bacterium]|nr:16S rRNA (adenine(1518)-N(6)/adenine(1519)-N(6))-dimethyltransferase RsmA [Lentisphaeria bacterium]